ncbi:PLP-dependent transferase [Staphylococcus epidermidis]|uniref:PLP-dependent transferase n=1 Tax=Staphylococcus epidermidis TaxID=1282 RepID=UPI0021B1E86D|nr:PLP-dependent transferase [Staphylococcus epidermidis]
MHPTNYFTLPHTLPPLQSLISLPPLITHPSIPSHVTPKEGITHPLIRLSIPIQHTQHLVNHLQQPLNTFR